MSDSRFQIKMNQHDQEAFPLEPESFLGNIVRLLKARGFDEQIVLLLTGKLSLDYREPYSSNEWATTWNLSVELIPEQYVKLDGSRDYLVRPIEKVGNELLSMNAPSSENEYHKLTCSILSRYSDESDWREKAYNWFTGRSISNQANVRSDSPPRHEEDGLFFRSWPEIHLYRALKSNGVVFAPLPVFLQGGKEYRRIEPDFIIVKDGIIMHLEVDGDRWHQESPLEAHKRSEILWMEGAIHHRISAGECDTKEKAFSAVGKIIELIEKHKRNR